MDSGSISVPSDWKTGRLSEKGATFRNDHRGLVVEIRAVYRGSKVRKHARKPTHYVVQLKQDWFAKGTIGNRETAAKVDTAEEALTVAERFMGEFNREMKAQSAAAVQAVHTSVGDHEAADDILTSEVAAEALADAAGYSDDLLLSVLDAETNEQYALVAHRDGSTITAVAGDESESGFDESRLKQIHAVFPVDTQGTKPC